MSLSEHPSSSRPFRAGRVLAHVILWSLLLAALLVTVAARAQGGAGQEPSPSPSSGSAQASEAGSITQKLLPGSKVKASISLRGPSEGLVLAGLDGLKESMTVRLHRAPSQGSELQPGEGDAWKVGVESPPDAQQTATRSELLLGPDEPLKFDLDLELDKTGNFSGFLSSSGDRVQFPSGEAQYIKVRWGAVPANQLQIDLLSTPLGGNEPRALRLPQAPSSSTPARSDGLWLATALLALWVALWPAISARIAPLLPDSWSGSPPTQVPPELVSQLDKVVTRTLNANLLPLKQKLDSLNSPIGAGCHPDEVGDSGELLSNIQLTVQESSRGQAAWVVSLNQRLSETDTALGTLQRTTADMAGALQKLQQTTEGTPGALQKLQQNLEQTTQNVSSMIRSLKKWADELQDFVLVQLKGQSPVGESVVLAGGPSAAAPVPVPLSASGVSQVRGASSEVASVQASRDPAVSSSSPQAQTSSRFGSVPAVQPRPVPATQEYHRQVSRPESVPDRWRRLRNRLYQVAQQPPESATFRDCLTDEEGFYDYLLEHLDVIGSPKDSPHFWWNGDNLAELDRFLYGLPNFGPVEGYSSEVAALVAELRSAIRQIQQKRIEDIHQRFGVSRLVDKKPVPGLVESDSSPVPTSDSHLDGLVCEIVPGRGGYRWEHDGQCDILGSTRARLYVYRPEL